MGPVGIMVRREARGAATKLYQRAGFVRCGTLPRAIRVDDRDFDKDHMVLHLPRTT